MRIRLLFLLALCTGVAAAALPPQDLEDGAQRLAELRRFDPDYLAKLHQRGTRLRELGARVYARERDGQNTARSHQILNECVWLATSTALMARLDERIAALEASLAHPELEAGAERQDPSDGSWGSAYTVWFFRLDASYDHLDRPSNQGEKGLLPCRFLDRVNSPQRLTDYLTGLSVSDLAADGIDHRREFNESVADLMRLILHDRPEGYPWDPALKGTIVDLLLHRFRHPDTGWWGESYRRDGKLVPVDDLSITFHIISYLDGKVSDLACVVDTTLALKDENTPTGWLMNGRYWNHNNMDVVTLFRYGWPEASPAQRAAMATEIENMLHWCLSESLQADGTFAPVTGDGSLEEGEYFGASFLVRVGYFDKARRFWTDRDFPEAEAVRARLIATIRKRLASGGAGGTYYENALLQLTN